ncbi:MAG: polyribonucleotide nucleotidyltransferase [bacterium]
MIKKVEMDFDGKTLSLETGRVAREAGGAVIVRLGDTMVLATATASELPKETVDFFPLTVDFEEKLYAAGKIPGGFFKREGRPTEKAILTSRLVDRPIRPLFPDNFRNEVQIVVTPLSVDQDNAPDVLAMIGASAALTISDIPFMGPAGAVRVGKVGDKLIINPNSEQMEQSELDIIVAGTKDAVMMVEAGADEVSEDVVLSAIELAHSRIKDVIKLQEELAKLAGNPKLQPKLYEPNKDIEKCINDLASKKISAALEITDREKQNNELKKIEQDAIASMKKGELAEIVKERPYDVKAVIKSIEKKIVRDMIINKHIRPDGRKFEDIRPISCEVGLLPRVHGSAIFTRGTTQVMTVATLGAMGEEQRIEGLEPESKKRYMHHYNFPAFSVGEVRPLRGPGRREIGHGALAERALLPVLPPEEKFPYTIRLVSEILMSNGSTSMASTCGSTLALMDAGIPISAPVSGIAMGLIKEGDKVAVLSDIQGIEDFLGDMDFKVAGTSKGITALQMDIKIKGISIEIMRKALEQAKLGRAFILSKMTELISNPRQELSQFAPRVITLSVPIDKIGLVIGPGGKNIKRIIEETGVQVDIEDDGRVFITGADVKGAEAAKNIIEGMTAEAEIGKTYLGKVTRIMNFGAFVEIMPGKEGLVHISQLAERRVAKVEDVVKVGDEIKVKVVEIDDQGRINLSKKAAG